MKKSLIISLCAISLILTGCKGNIKSDVELKEPLKPIDNLNIEINESKKMSDVVNKRDDITLKNGDEEVDTSKLGEKEITLKYVENNEEKEMTFKINVVDTTPPEIEYKEELSTTKGKKIDLLKNTKVSDNSKEKIKATVEGEYDVNKEGSYKLKYVATDSSNNKIEKEFTLNVTKSATTDNRNKTTKVANTNSGNKGQASNSSLEEYEKELDRLEDIRKTKSVLYTYDPTNELNALINPKFKNNISPDIYKRVFYYTCEKTAENETMYVVKCDGGDKGCNEKAVKKFKELHKLTECNVATGVSPKYTYYVHSGYTGFFG